MSLRTIRLALWGLVLVAGAALAVQQWTGREKSAETLRPDFALQDGKGQTYTMVDFRGKFSLVFFGFTNCPDVCPTTMSEVAQVMDDLGEGADRVQPLFISIDPERDRRQGLTEYVAAFHPAILGLSGDDAATKDAANSFKIYFGREEDPSAPDGYTMSHSSGLYLIGPDGEWLRQFAYETPAAEILADIEKRILP
ncbi:electron transport protein SCO1/SenC (plasmid) [Paracoccus yeei]|uniref:Electron transport protein SCO1/SenC n=2 Tax=Paracoccus TaxID=265 RepID=A0A2P1BUM9_9RHOB|nr:MULTISPECIES: SCO family protein [Paracoccus]AVI58418.1 electron transport protein SCO1/SenC [Paracoccus yeei]MTE02059.1 redoxin domain-containing protein [Paracoccus lichenicola]